MTWRDRLKLPSFRGVPFRLDESELVGERRSAVHEFLTSDRFGVDDLGRRPKQITIQGYTVGPDYDAQRNALIAAFDARGPGDLDFGTYGRQRVRVLGQYVFSERRRDAAFASFRVTFLEHRVELDRLEVVPTKQRVLDAWEDIRAVAAAPPNDLLTLAKQARKQVRSVLGTVLGVVAKVRALNDYAQELIAVAEGIAGDVFAVYDAIGDLFGVFEDTVFEVGAKLSFYRDLFAMQTDEIVGNGFVSSSRRRAAAALTQDTRAQAVGGFAATAVREEFATRDHVESRITEINAMVATMLDSADTRPEIVVALRALRGDAEAYLRQVALNLPTLATIEVMGTTSLRLSYRMIGDTSRARSIAQRNRIRNPLLISGPVEVRAVG